MLIGITGDTHGDQQAIKKLVKKAPTVAKWLHTGDFFLDADVLAKESELPVISVAGNNDVATVNDLNRVFIVAGHKVWLTHGHKFIYRGITNLLYKAEELGVEVVVYGHTHIPEIAWHGDILSINPGSPSYPRGGSKRGFVLLELTEGEKPRAEYVAL